MDAVAALMFALVFILTLLPLVAVLPTAPPMSDEPDDASPIPLERSEKPNRRRKRANWRISASLLAVWPESEQMTRERSHSH